MNDLSTAVDDPGLLEGVRVFDLTNVLAGRSPRINWRSWARTSSRSRLRERATWLGSSVPARSSASNGSGRPSWRRTRASVQSRSTSKRRRGMRLSNGSSPDADVLLEELPARCAGAAGFQLNSNFFWMFQLLLGVTTRGTLKALTFVTFLASLVSRSWCERRCRAGHRCSSEAGPQPVTVQRPYLVGPPSPITM